VNFKALTSAKLLSIGQV